MYYTDTKKWLLPSTVHVIMKLSIQHLALHIEYKNVVDKLRLALYRTAQTITAFFAPGAVSFLPAEIHNNM